MRGASRTGGQAPALDPADIVRFKNGAEDWIAFVGLQDGRPYEIFTGKIEEDAMYIPRKITKGLHHQGPRGGRLEALRLPVYGPLRLYEHDRRHLASVQRGVLELRQAHLGVLRHGMPIEKTVSLIESLHLDSESINTWKTGVCRALKQYIVDGTKSKGKCPSCGQENMPTRTAV